MAAPTDAFMHAMSTASTCCAVRSYPVDDDARDWAHVVVNSVGSPVPEPPNPYVSGLKFDLHRASRGAALLIGASSPAVSGWSGQASCADARVVVVDLYPCAGSRDGLAGPRIGAAALSAHTFYERRARRRRLALAVLAPATRTVPQVRGPGRMRDLAAAGAVVGVAAHYWSPPMPFGGSGRGLAWLCKHTECLVIAARRIAQTLDGG